MRRSRSALALAAMFLPLAAVRAQAPSDPAELKQFEDRRNTAYAQQLEAWLRNGLVDQYPGRAAKAWKRDYSSVGAFLKSVEPNREGWRRVLKPPQLVKTGPARRTPHAPLADLKAQWMVVPL